MMMLMSSFVVVGGALLLLLPALHPSSAPSFVASFVVGGTLVLPSPRRMPPPSSSSPAVVVVPHIATALVVGPVRSSTSSTSRRLHRRCASSTRTTSRRIGGTRRHSSSSSSSSSDDYHPPAPSRNRESLIEEYDKLERRTRSTAVAVTDGDENARRYAVPTWSNRLGSVLTPASIPDVYTADRPFLWYGIDVGGRMTVIRSRSGGLIVHSPVNLDAPLMDALSSLGTVAHVICPNYEHVKYARMWGECYPNARVWGCPGLTSRETDVRWTGEIPYGARPPSGSSSGITGAIDGMWDWNELMPYHVDFEINPFTGRPFFNEVLFYHGPSRTLLTTDFYWNYPRRNGITNDQIGIDDDDEEEKEEEDYGSWELAPNVGPIPLGSVLWGKVGMDRLFHPFYVNFMVGKDGRGAFEEMARYVTCGEGDGDDDGKGWIVETIIPCHGDIVRGRRLCRKVLEKHFGIKS